MVVDMDVTLRTHYSLNFDHHELVEIGFDPGDLCRLYRYTSKQTRKFLVMWDNDKKPHFGFPDDGTSSLADSYKDFYGSLVTWVYHKTNIQTYRVIHRSNRVHLLFGHHQDSVNPQLIFPTYDFQGFEPNFQVNPDGSSHLSWKVLLNKNDAVPKEVRLPATLRPIS